MNRDATERPDFLWDESLTRSDLRQILEAGNEQERIYYTAKILREARFEEVWDYISPAFLSSHWEKLRGKLGRRNGFWEFFYVTWRRHGLIA